MRAIIRDIYLRVFGTFRKPKPGVHIINSHYITANATSPLDREIMRSFMSFLNKFATFLTLEEAVKRIENNQTDEGIFIAFTFDDGFEECYEIIAPVLEEFNTRGAFFINANYPESSEDYRNAYNERVVTFTKDPMSWSQIKDLHSRGHLIGSHTLDHYNLAELSSEQIELQLKTNKDILEKQLSYHCEHFAWTYGGMEHFPLKAQSIAQKYHKYLYSGTDFKHYYGRDKSVLNRRHLEPNWPKSHVKYFLSHHRE